LDGKKYAQPSDQNVFDTRFDEDDLFAYDFGRKIEMYCLQCYCMIAVKASYRNSKKYALAKLKLSHTSNTKNGEFTFYDDGSVPKEKMRAILDRRRTFFQRL
jgi:hypothetical protein